MACPAGGDGAVEQRGSDTAAEEGGCSRPRCPAKGRRQQAEQRRPSEQQGSSKQACQQAADVEGQQQQQQGLQKDVEGEECCQRGMHHGRRRRTKQCGQHQADAQDKDGTDDQKHNGDDDITRYRWAKWAAAAPRL